MRPIDRLPDFVVFYPQTDFAIRKPRCVDAKNPHFDLTVYVLHHVVLLLRPVVAIVSIFAPQRGAAAKINKMSLL